MTAMSRSARIRANRRAPITRHTPDQTRADLPASSLAGIRNVGYQTGNMRSRVRYSGSGDAGYASDWSRPANLPYSVSRVTNDRRWDLGGLAR